MMYIRQEEAPPDDDSYSKYSSNGSSMETIFKSIKLPIEQQLEKEE